MHIIWKRPDGFQNSIPDDFRRLGLSNGSHLWLHKHELDWYPFQVSGDWRGQIETQRINRLVNLLDAADKDWEGYLHTLKDNDFTATDDLPTISSKIIKWVEEVSQHAKGNTWEVEIMKCAFHDISERLKKFI